MRYWRRRSRAVFDFCRDLATSQRVYAAGTISFVSNDLLDCLAGPPDACCSGYAWQLQDADVSCPGSPSAFPGCN